MRHVAAAYKVILVKVKAWTHRINRKLMRCRMMEGEEGRGYDKRNLKSNLLL